VTGEKIRTSAFSVVVFGKPQPAGSKRAFVNRHTGRAHVVDAAKGSAPWKQEVAGAALRACVGEPLLLTGPLELTVRFFLARPKGHYRTGRNAALLRDGAPGYPAIKPDATKLLRAVEDALTGIVWRDDAQIVFQVCSKAYGLPERCEIEVDRAPAPVTASALELVA
jgi:Holliday junction resolvase RusA-like endonuclease